MAEQSLEDIWIACFLKLISGSFPLSCGFTVFRIISILANINGIVHKTHLLICSLMFECIAILLPILHHKLNDLRRGIGNFDGIGLDVSDGISALLHLMLQVDHK